MASFPRLDWDCIIILSRSIGLDTKDNMNPATGNVTEREGRGGGRGEKGEGREKGEGEKKSTHQHLRQQRGSRP
jgi:hypothetical protein